MEDTKFRHCRLCGDLVWCAVPTACQRCREHTRELAKRLRLKRRKGRNRPSGTPPTVAEVRGESLVRHLGRGA